MSGEVAPDGSPVDIYLALPAGDVPTLIQSAIPRKSSILELGSGPGRLTHPLIELGHRVTAVDNSPEMLAHVHRGETVVADVYTLDLARTFDAVVAASHLINAPERDRRIQLLGVCRRHVGETGVVLVERYDPHWVASPRASKGQVGDVTVDFEPIEIGDGRFRGRVRYTLGSRSWTQEFTAAQVSDDILREETEETGLRLMGWLNDSRTWALLGPEK